MCGICGFFCDAGGVGDSPERLDRMIAALAHRGPDGSGRFHADGIGLGHARLSIIDLEGGRQPLSNEDESLVLVCNGEIYNYRELRSGLLERGHRFRTASDSEVILHLWEEQGERCLDQLRGMFAFALYDRKSRQIFLARDRFGQKPLYYYQDAQGLIFASEIKSILCHPQVPRELDVAALDGFLFYQFVPDERTLFQGIRAVPPAGYAVVSQQRCEIRRYWNPQQDKTDLGAYSPAERVTATETALLDAVQSHLVSDVPVGIFLSGGIDSSLLAAMAGKTVSGKMKSFSIGFDDQRYDETEYARIAAKHAGTEHTVFRFNPDEVMAGIHELSGLMDQPLADDAALPLLFLSRQAAREIKVVLTGDGGDELFAGYAKYRGLAGRRRSGFGTWLRERWIAPRELAGCAPDPFSLRRLKSRLGLKWFPELAGCYYKHFWEGWDRNALYSPELRQRLSAETFPFPPDPPVDVQAATALSELLWWDRISYLPGALLLKTDMATMAYGLEARAPFLDHLLAAHAAGIPEQEQVSGTETKRVLRRLAEKWLPEELVHRPKRGFGLPLRSWLQNELAPWVKELLLESSVTVPRYFSEERVTRLIQEHVAGRANHTGRIYTLLVFELWHRKYLS